MAVVPFIPVAFIPVGLACYRAVRRAAGLGAGSGDRSPSLAAAEVGRAAGAGGRRRPKRAAAEGAVGWSADAVVRAAEGGGVRAARASAAG